LRLRTEETPTGSEAKPPCPGHDHAHALSARERQRRNWRPGDLLGTSGFAQRKLDAYLTLPLSITAGDIVTSVSLSPLAAIRRGGELLDVVI